MRAGVHPARFLMKYAAIAFSIFILVVIILADRDAIPPFIRALYDFPYGDKLGHFILYGLLNFFLTRAFLPRFALNRKLIALSVGLTLALIVAAEEFSQQFFSARTFDLVDLAARYVGVFAGGWAAWKFKK
ncbi:MAG: VanZ family protein [Anaerolineales bacterium]|nr:VanZ family protein [Anaerolineales bacterium]